MASSEEGPTSVPGETLENGVGALTGEPVSLEEEGKTQAEEEGGEMEQGLQKSGGSSTEGNAGSSPADGEEPDKTLARADELFEKGSKAIEDDDFVEAVDCLSRALEIRVAHYGELASECAMSYYKYGCALLYKAQEEADPLGNVPNHSPRNSEATVTNVEKGGSSKNSGSDAKRDCDEEVGEGPSDKDQEDDNEGSEGDGEDLGEADEDESDLDLAWKMLDVARAIVEKHPEYTMEKVNIFAALGEVSMEREDIETSLSDYQKALSILEHLVEPDHRRMVELNFRICLVLELGSKIAEAIPFCEKAISMCKSRLQRLKEDVMKLKGLMTTAADAGLFSNPNESHNQSSGGPHSDRSILEKEEEIELIGGILSELEKKLEDLQQVMSNPKNILSEVLKAVSVKSTSGKNNTSIAETRSISFNSSQAGVINGGFDSPTVSTAATNGNVTHLGVVGRGIKRASITPVAEPSPKQPSLDLSAEEADSNASEVLDSSARHGNSY